jgi:hypothetical protein
VEGKGGRCVGLTTLPPSFADCPEIWEPQPPATLWACNRPAQGLLCLYHLLVQNTNYIGKYSYRLLNPQELCFFCPLCIYGSHDHHNKQLLFSVGFYNAKLKVGTGLSYIAVMDRRLAVVKPAASTCYGGCASAQFASIRRQTSKVQRDDIRLPCHEMARASICNTQTDASFLEAVGLYILGDPRFLRRWI